MTEQMGESDALVQVLVRHRFHETDPAGRGFCGAPYCGGGIVSVEAHAEHVAAMIRAQSSDDDAACTWAVYVVHYSDPERYRTESLEREDCPVHRVIPPGGSTS